MPFDQLKDFAYSTIAVAPSPATSGTSLTVQGGDGDLFPAADFYATVWPAGSIPLSTNREIVKVSRSGDVFTITRARRGTTARAITIGDQIGNTIMAETFDAIKGVTWGMKTVDMPAETTPSTISNTLYNSFGILGKFASGKLIIVYREGHKHGGTGDFGAIRYIISTDQGHTWGSPVTIDDGTTHSPDVDLRDVGGGITRTGRLVIWYGTYDPSHFASPGGGGYPLTLGYRYSDDEGQTWSSFTTISTGANDYTFAVHGPMIEVANGRLMKNWYGWTISGGGFGTATLYVLFSDDDGETWGNQVTVVSSSSIEYDEASFAYLGGSYIVGVCRKSNGTTFRQFQSADNGATWVNEGDTSFDSWTTPSPPSLMTYTDLTGARQVACYYTNRDAGKVRVVTASATSIMSAAASAWGTPADLVTGISTTDFGYIGVIHPYADGRGLGWFYKGISSSQADITFFISSLNTATLPANPGDATKFLNGASTPAFAQVKDSDLSLSDITTNNFSTSKHGFVPKGTNTGKFLKDDGTWGTPTDGSTWSVLTDGNSNLIFASGDVIMVQS